MTKLTEPAQIQQVVLDRACELQRACHRLPHLLNQPQQRERNESHSDLNAHGVLGNARKVPDLQLLFDPMEKPPNRLSLLGVVRDLLRRTGCGKGLHVVVPLVAKRLGEDVRAWRKRFAEDAIQAAPIVTLVR